VPRVSGPEVTVVIPSHARQLRLRWLLNSLEEQKLDSERFEVVVVHDYDDRDTHDIIERHPLTAGGTLRHVRIQPGTGQPARQRNLGWRAARAPLVAFTDDDCRADPGWLAGYLAQAQPGSEVVLQGVTKTEPYEYETWAAPHVRTIDIPHPPNEFFQTCNILYPRSVLERLGGFDETLTSGEDTDLALRALAAGVRIEGAPAAVVYHAVEEYSLPRMLRMSWKWRDLVRLRKRHPQLAQTGEWTLGVFWKASHWQLLLAAAGAGLARRFPSALLLAAPYLRAKLLRRGSRPRQLAVAAAELPGQALVDAGEIAAMAAGSIEHRALVL
jgi:GT2 family glycosyltransferase